MFLSCINICRVPRKLFEHEAAALEQTFAHYFCSLYDPMKNPVEDA